MKIEINLREGPTSGPTIVKIDMSKKQYSQPKLYIPKKNGKPIAEPGHPWYVWFLWRNAETGKLDIKCKFKKGINRYKTVKERKAVGEALIKAYETALDRGWDPITKTAAREKSSRKQATTLEKAMNYAFSIKKATKKASTLHGYEFHLKRFLEWAKDNGYLGMDIYKFTIDHFYEFLDHIRFEYSMENGEAMSGTSVNNHKRSLSALFTTLKNERMIPVNFVKDIPKVDEDPVNNKAFTTEEIITIKKKLEKEDPYLVYYIQFLLYPLLRPLEVCRLKVKDINTNKWFLTVETKTAKHSKRRIIDKMKPTLQALKIEGAPANYHVFSYKNKPHDWSDAKEKSRADHFGERFRKIKKELGFGREYGLYSFRHTAIMDLFHSFQETGMGEQEIYLNLMPITQHRSLEGLKKYLRKHRSSLPPDHSDIYTIDF